MHTLDSIWRSSPSPLASGRNPPPYNQRLLPIFLQTVGFDVRGQDEQRSVEILCFLNFIGGGVFIIFSFPPTSSRSTIK